MDDDLLSLSDESSSDDADIMNDVTQPHVSEAKDDKEDEKTDLSTNRLTDSSPHLTPSGFLLYPRNFFHPTTGLHLMFFSFVKCWCQTDKMTSVDEMLQVASLDITGAASMPSERLGIEVTQECIQYVWAACAWQQKKMSCREVVVTENSTFVSNITKAVPLDASQTRMTKEEEMKVCINRKE